MRRVSIVVGWLVAWRTSRGLWRRRELAARDGEAVLCHFEDCEFESVGSQLGVVLSDAGRLGVISNRKIRAQEAAVEIAIRANEDQKARDGRRATRSGAW